jgi:hypothetical protein
MFMSSIFIFIVFSSSGNIASPVQMPPDIGDMFGSKEENPIRIDKEVLSLDISPGLTDLAPCTASYIMTNPTQSIVVLPMLFLTPGAKDIEVSVNDASIEAEYIRIPHNTVPWTGKERDREYPIDYGAARFIISFNPSETKKVFVRFRLTRGYDFTAAPYGPTAPQAAHLLNQIKRGETIVWYKYDLFASSSFKGGFGTLNISIKVAYKDDVVCNLGLKKTGENRQEGYYFLTGTYTGLPDEFIDIKQIVREDYNPIGITFGAGWLFPFDGRPISFTLQGLFDVSFRNNMFSAGIEADPFSGLYRGLIVYTLFPSGKAGRYDADLRARFAVALDLVNNFSPGFRLSGGFRLSPLAFELSYGIFPFEPVGFEHELGCMFVLGV